MSVKAFLQKYWKDETPSVSSAPVQVLEPMVGTKPRVAESSNPLHIFTDGACSDNGKKTAKGGFGVYVYGKPELDISQPLSPREQQTNNRAELRAIQAALDLIDQHEFVWLEQYTEFFIWSDSEYSIHCLTKWAKGWRANNWKKRDGGLIQNLDLIKPLYERIARMPRVSLHHVRGHQDSKKHIFPFDGNHKADLLATRSIV